MDYDEFDRLIQQRGEELYRDMPWRNDTRPYNVLVSEIMLQQTQVDRVIPKYEKFLQSFPSIESLARASLGDVLMQWQGLGYNRRAKYLHESAKVISQTGDFPHEEKALTLLPGIGKNTAGAIMAYAYDKPAFFIETNIRAVYIHHFFSGKDNIDDKDIVSIMMQSKGLLREPRAFYWALMDYGTWLKKQGVDPSRSRHYRKQAPLKGSIREVRGQIIKLLVGDELTLTRLQELVNADERFDVALNGLMSDGLVSRRGEKLYLTK